MTIYQVVYYNHYYEIVADFGFYEDKLDAEKRALEIRVKTPDESGSVKIEEVFVHDSSDDTQKKQDNSTEITKSQKDTAYNLKQ